MPSHECDGLRLAYQEIGDGAPLLFVHGATGTGEFDWGRLAAALSSRYRCVLPDLRGHGRSATSWPGPMTGLAWHRRPHQTDQES